VNIYIFARVINTLVLVTNHSYWHT